MNSCSALTPTDAHRLHLPSSSPAPASKSIYDLLVDPTLADDTLPPLYSPPTSPCGLATSGLPIAATSDIHQPSLAPSSPLASTRKSAAAITIHTDSSPPAPLQPAISITSSADTSPPRSPITIHTDSSPPAIPSQSQPASLQPAISITSSDDDSPPPSPTHTSIALERFSGEKFCSRAKQDCLMTQAPRLDFIGPCKLFKNNIVILVSTGATSPTRWTDVGPLTTFVLYGNDFVQAFRSALPRIYSPLVRLKVVDDIPVAVRSRLTQAKPPPGFTHRPIAGLALPLSTLAHMATMLLQERSGINLVTSFSWREPRAVHTVDVIPRDLLTEHLRKAQNIANGSDPESDPISEYTEPDSIPELMEPGDLPEW
ncbi:hypothetical protein BD410DRAFT_846575 [Rickenella mellea]|uniref:Uncharacterized protein n=1 Tax=Rickenella mellea TaxID=50990 RepID=A0A4Y7PG69_9AGAM|nr:hypothetical protein BD410DRAFT_846575 [Rickenella mellea]